jgi:hypothetical protein
MRKTQRAAAAERQANARPGRFGCISGVGFKRAELRE